MEMTTGENERVSHMMIPPRFLSFFFFFGNARFHCISRNPIKNMNGPSLKRSDTRGEEEEHVECLLD